LAKKVTPSVGKVLESLLERQDYIAKGSLKPSIDKLLGVNVQANMDTQESVPYLTHSDFTRCIKELTDFCDYIVLNLCADKQSSGLKQYYNNEAALGKFLKAAVDARNHELGLLAAYEYEELVQDAADYTTSVKRFYTRNTTVSTLRPTLLFL
jgi:dihydroorotate dehydrogenase